MVQSVADRCRTCIFTLRSIGSFLSTTENSCHTSCAQAVEQLDRLSLWTGNIGALHSSTSSLSVESRLSEADDVRHHVLELLEDLNDASAALYDIVSGQREGQVGPPADDPASGGQEDGSNEESELVQEINACITRLFRVSGLIRRAAPSSVFDKALSRNRYHYSDQFDIAHVGDKFPKLTKDTNRWLQTRLGRAITQRRRYLADARDHRDKLEGDTIQDEIFHTGVTRSVELEPKLMMGLLPEATSRPST